MEEQTKLNVLIIGSGGREHALGWSVAQDPEVEEVFYFKGNPGTDAEPIGININTDGTKKENFDKVYQFVKGESIDAVIVGPEQPLVDGIVDF